MNGRVKPKHYEKGCADATSSIETSLTWHWTWISGVESRRLTAWNTWNGLSLIPMITVKVKG